MQSRPRAARPSRATATVRLPTLTNGYVSHPPRRSQCHTNARASQSRLSPFPLHRPQLASIFGDAAAAAHAVFPKKAMLSFR